MRSLKEYTGKFYIKTTFQDVVALQYKLLCGQVNILMFLFVSSSPWDIPCPVKLLLSLLYTRQKTKVFRLFGTSGCYHPLRLHVFSTKHSLFHHIPTLLCHPPVCPTCDLKHFTLWSVCQLNFLSWSHTLLHKNYKYLWVYWGIQTDHYHTYILSLLLEDKCFIYPPFPFLIFFPP